MGFVLKIKNINHYELENMSQLLYFQTSSNLNFKLVEQHLLFCYISPFYGWDNNMLAIFLDIESSGLDFFCHRALEVAFKIIDAQSGEEKYRYETVVKQPFEVWEKRDPISVGINGFTWEKVLTGKEESVIRQEIIQIFNTHHIERGKAIYICQNPAFDRGFFSQLVDTYTQEQNYWPYHWLDFASMYWALQVKQGATPSDEMALSKNSIAQHYQLPVEPYPHCAINGVNHLLLCYRTVVGFGKEATKLLQEQMIGS